MDKEHIHKFAGKKKHLLISLVGILNILLIFLIVWIGVGISNRIKEGRYIGQDIESRNTITVSDTGEVYTKPDLALVTLSVLSESKTVAEAMQDNTEKMNTVIKFAKNQGVEAKDLKTTSFNISPRYEWQEKGTCVPPCPSGRRVLVGYEIRQSLQVKIRNMEQIGNVLEGATDAGANEVGNLQFTVDNKEALKKQARDQAIEKAKNKAKELALKLGVDLVRISSFSESGSSLRFAAFDEASYGIGGGAVPEIETGEDKIEITVDITYEIN